MRSNDSYPASSFTRWGVLLLLVGLATTSAHAQSGYWHTSGNQILDSSGRTVRIAGVNWYGFETTDEVVHGLWAQDYHYIMNAIVSNGYNVVRIPFSNQMVESPIVPTNISYQNGSGPINTDLQGPEFSADPGQDRHICRPDWFAHYSRQPSFRGRQQR